MGQSNDDDLKVTYSVNPSRCMYKVTKYIMISNIPYLRKMQTTY